MCGLHNLCGLHKLPRLYKGRSPLPSSSQTKGGAISCRRMMFSENEACCGTANGPWSQLRHHGCLWMHPHQLSGLCPSFAVRLALARPRNCRARRVACAHQPRCAHRVAGAPALCRRPARLPPGHAHRAARPSSARCLTLARQRNYRVRSAAGAH